MPIVAPLLELSVVSLVLLLVGCALAIALIMRYIGDVFRGLPVVGGPIAGVVDRVAQAITSAAGKIESGIDKLVGASWHLLAHYLDQQWQQLVSQATLAAQIAEIVGRLVYDHSGLRALVHRAERVLHGIEHGVKDLTRKYHGIDRRVRTLEREIAHGIGHDLRIQVKALEREVTGIEKGVIPGLRADIKTAEADLTDLEDWLGLRVGSTFRTWAESLAIAALAALGLSGLRCNTLLRSLANRGCGLWNGLEDLFGLFIDLLFFTHICELLPPLEALVGEVADPLVVGLTDIGAGLCKGGIGVAPTLAVPALSLPANPGITLNLP